MGTLREDNSFSPREQKIIHTICSGIFSQFIHPRFLEVFEITSTLLQFSVLHEYYDYQETPKLYSQKYYNKYYTKPLEKFLGDKQRAFACYCFICWFCSDYHQIPDIENQFLAGTDSQQIVKKLLNKFFSSLKEQELKRDYELLDSFSKNYQKIDSQYVSDLVSFIQQLIAFRKELFSSIDHITALLTDTTCFCNWITNDALKTYYLVDFGKALPLKTELTENYYASKWFTENQRFLFYDDCLGKQILTFEELDDLVNMQLLYGFLINFTKKLDLHTIIASEKFLECDISSLNSF